MAARLVDGMPDFLIIGAGKSGTTSIDKYLSQHPQVFMPARKEPNFFGYENVVEADLGKNPDDLAHFRNSATNLTDYLKIFAGAKPGQKRGETSNTYLYREQAAERILHYVPDVKLIAILRQPADRLFSRYMHLVRENRPPSPTFAECLNRDSIWWKRNDLIREGFYYRNLSRYFNLFPVSNIRIYLYEDLNENPLELMRDLYSFIGVDPDFQPDVTMRFNESGAVRNRLLNKIIGQGGWLSQTASKFFPRVYQQLRSNRLIRKRMLRLRKRNLTKGEIEPAIRKALTLDIYGDDIRQLQNLIGRDLSRWLNV